MDTPDRAAAQSAASRTEDSPVFSFLNNLSPIEPLRSSAYSTNSLQGFQSINITSISSIFTSPHDNVSKEPRLPKSPLGEINEKEEVRADAAGTNGPSEPSNAARLFACTSTVTRETRTGTGTGVAGPPPTTGGPCDLALPRQFDNNGSPDHNTTPCHGVRSDLKQDKARKLLQAEKNATNALEKRKCLFSTEVRLLDGGGGGGEPGSDSDGVLGCEWSDLVSPTSAKLLAFDATMDEHHRGVHLAAQNAESCGYLLSKLAGDGGVSDGAYPTASAQVYYQELVIGEDQSENAAPQMDAQETISAEEIQDNIYEANLCVPLEYKVVESQQQRGIRRRCLVFEAAGGFSNSAVKRGAIEDRSVSTCSKGKSPAQSQPRGLRGIGLHLNALALTPKGKMASACQDPPPTASALLPSSASGKDARGELLCAGENFAHSGGELLEFPLDDCSAGGFPVNDHHVSGQSVSPQKKRRKTDNGDDGEACKRCSCKKSKCLKLYCECFAAGVYCSEPCSCQGCMNKPIHEETVLSTRKQIEFRNPLAFAPKVIRMSDAGLETGEDPNNTPASARHKRGCNCKKSSCLKKYCECYQGGVGCSSNCRCESCKNAFGRRDAETELPEEMKQESDQTENPQQEKENDQQKANVQREDHPLLDLVPITPPFDFCSSLLKLPNFSSAKPPRPTKARSVSSRSSASKATAAVQPCRSSKLAASASASASGIDEETPDILHEPDSLSNCVKTTTSPNGKRVSPPHNALSSSPNRKGGRKLILKSIPLFPSLTGDTNSGSAMNSTDSAFCASPLSLGPS